MVLQFPLCKLLSQFFLLTCLGSIDICKGPQNRDKLAILSCRNLEGDDARLPWRIASKSARRR